MLESDVVDHVVFALSTSDNHVFIVLSGHIVGSVVLKISFLDCTVSVHEHVLTWVVEMSFREFVGRVYWEDGSSVATLVGSVSPLTLKESSVIEDLSSEAIGSTHVVNLSMVGVLFCFLNYNSKVRVVPHVSVGD